MQIVIDIPEELYKSIPTKEYIGYMDMSDWQKIVFAVSSGTVLPIVEESEQDPCDDAISRQAAIDCFTATKLKKFDFILYARAVLKQLPSVTPKQKMGRWIPVSERLPDNNARVLCCASSTSISGGYTRFVGCCNNGFWFVQTSAETLSYPRQYEVTAWMPLPEPYRAESEGEKV